MIKRSAELITETRSAMRGGNGTDFIIVKDLPIQDDNAIQAKDIFDNPTFPTLNALDFFVLLVIGSAGYEFKFIREYISPE